AGGFVVITGLVPGMSLSSGSAVGVNAWQVPLQYLADTWIGPPKNFVGEVKLIAELHLADAIIAHRQLIHFEWLPATTVNPAAAAEQGPNAAVVAGQMQVSAGAISPHPVAAPL